MRESRQKLGEAAGFSVYVRPGDDILLVMPLDPEHGGDDRVYIDEGDARQLAGLLTLAIYASKGEEVPK